MSLGDCEKGKRRIMSPAVRSSHGKLGEKYFAFGGILWLTQQRNPFLGSVENDIIPALVERSLLWP